MINVFLSLVIIALQVHSLFMAQRGLVIATHWVAYWKATNGGASIEYRQALLDGIARVLRAPMWRWSP